MGSIGARQCCYCRGEGLLLASRACAQRVPIWVGLGALFPPKELFFELWVVYLEGCEISKIKVEFLLQTRNFRLFGPDDFTVHAPYLI